MGHFASGVTSTAKLVKAVLRDGSFLTWTTADHSITYTDGPDGPLTYNPAVGATPSAFDQSASLSVDNAILSGMITIGEITEQQIRAGIFDGARFWIYEVNYLDLTMGHYIWSAGRFGKTKFSNNGFKVELRSKTQNLKQPIAEMSLLICPVPYGSPACGKEFEWFTAEIDMMSSEEPDRVFTLLPDSNWPDDNRFNRTGVVHVLTGDNAGAEVEVELQDGLDIELLLIMPYPFQTGDQFEIRIDCNKEARDEVGGCKSLLRWSDEWIFHHRGFPDIPVADQDSLRFPGAQAPSVPGTGTVNVTEEA
jgi:uncharacterized phage protein (TIGR02218 family)